MGYLYRGRHRAQTSSSTRRAVAAAVLTGAASLPLLTGVAQAADGADLDAIANCESSGNPSATNGTHFGLYQFDLATWRSVGGSGNPMDASVAEQTMRARQLMAVRGTSPWKASQSCWAGKSAPPPVKVAAKAKAQVKAKVKAPAKAHVSVKASVKAKTSWAAAATRGTYTVKPGDTLSGISPVHWREVWAANRATIGANPDKIIPGQHLSL